MMGWVLTETKKIAERFCFPRSVQFNFTPALKLKLYGGSTGRAYLQRFFGSKNVNKISHDHRDKEWGKYVHVSVSRKFIDNEMKMQTIRCRSIAFLLPETDGDKKKTLKTTTDTSCRDGDLETWSSSALYFFLWPSVKESGIAFP